MTVLRSKTLLNTINISKTRQARLQIQLTALRQERWLSIVVELEQRRAALDLSLDHAWRGDFDDTVLDECLAERVQEAGSDV